MAFNPDAKGPHGGPPVPTVGRLDWEMNLRGPGIKNDRPRAEPKPATAASDLVARLDAVAYRYMGESNISKPVHEAAATVIALRAEIARMRELQAR